MNLSDITVVIPTFLRKGLLLRCLNGINENLPECEIAISSDDKRAGILELWDRWVVLPFDSGLTVKRNAAVDIVETPYTLLGSDDFDFSLIARRGVEGMMQVMSAHPEIDVVCGVVGGRRHAGFLEYVPGEYIREHRLGWEPTYADWPLPVWRIDIGINYFLAKTSVLRDYPWDETIRPIGGEHADFFLTLKGAEKVVVYLPTAQINELAPLTGEVDPRYNQYRRRAHLGHEIFKRKRYIKEYIDFHGGRS